MLPVWPSRSQHYSIVSCADLVFGKINHLDNPPISRLMGSRLPTCTSLPFDHSRGNVLFIHAGRHV